jgi:hypothetical protein
VIFFDEEKRQKTKHMGQYTSTTLEMPTAAPPTGAVVEVKDIVKETNDANKEKTEEEDGELVKREEEAGRALEFWEAMHELGEKEEVSDFQGNFHAHPSSSPPTSNTSAAALSPPPPASSSTPMIYITHAQLRKIHDEVVVIQKENKALSRDKEEAQENFDTILAERNQRILHLETTVALLRQRIENFKRRLHHQSGAEEQQGKHEVEHEEEEEKNTSRRSLHGRNHHHQHNQPHKRTNK